MSGSAISVSNATTPSRPGRKSLAGAVIGANRSATPDAGSPCTLRSRMTHRVTLIPGDGTGPELTEATRRVLEATGVEFDWDVQRGRRRRDGVGRHAAAGGDARSVKANRVALKGPITTPIGTGFRSVNVALRHELGLYACLRPCKTYAGVRSRYDNVDLVIVRENTEDLYAGIEYEAGSADAEQVIAELNSCRRGRSPTGSGISIKPISRAGSERIIRFAFDYARAHGRKRVSCVTKANIMKFTDGLFLDTFREVAADYPEIEPWENLVDASAWARPAAGGVRRARAARTSTATSSAT